MPVDVLTALAAGIACGYYAGVKRGARDWVERKYSAGYTLVHIEEWSRLRELQRRDRERRLNVRGVP